MRVIRLAVTPSTQDIARRLPVGTCVVTDYQTAGRGRLDRRWEAPPQTALLASWVLRPRSLALFAAGVATAESCGAAVRLKWPNDLLLGDAKLGGMLAEQRRDRCVVGIGINLHWSPPGGARLGVDRDLLLDIVSERLEDWFAAADDDVLTAWRLRTATLGRRVRVQLADEVLEGIAEDIARDGSLIVAGRRVAAGDVVHLRPRPSPEDERPRPSARSTAPPAAARARGAAPPGTSTPPVGRT